MSFFFTSLFPPLLKTYYDSKTREHHSAALLLPLLGDSALIQLYFFLKLSSTVGLDKNSESFTRRSQSRYIGFRQSSTDFKARRRSASLSKVDSSSSFLATAISFLMFLSSSSNPGNLTSVRKKAVKAT